MSSPGRSKAIQFSSGTRSLQGLETDKYTLPVDPDITALVPIRSLKKSNSHASSPVMQARYLSLNDAVYDHTAQDFNANELNKPSLNNGLSESLTSPPLYPGGFPRAPRPHPFAKDFEPPRWRNIIIHILMCIVAYPLLIMFVYVARNKPLFWTRLIVSLGCGIVGFFLGLSLLGLGRAFLEAATWATVIHQSRVDDNPGIKLKDLAANSMDPTSSLVALRLLWDRSMYPGTSRSRRSHYDPRPWSLVILFFLFLVLLAGSLPFVLGRLVDITTTVTRQHENYNELSISADNSDLDISRAKALDSAFNDFSLTWTLSPFSNHGGLPPVVTFKYQNDTVYFSETIPSQLLPNGSGFGTFDTKLNSSTTVPDKFQSVTSDASKTSVQPGSVLRFPKWGTRLHCSKLPDIKTNLVPKSPNGFTYVFTPTAVLQSLLSSFGNISFPALPSLNVSRVLLLNDTLPPGIDPSQIAIGGAFYDNGVAHSFFSRPLTLGEEGQGWVSVEHVLVRLNTTYTPNGTFPILSNVSVPDVNGNPTYVGYDAAVCVQLFEPWIVEVYNNTIGLPSTISLVEPGSVVRSVGTGNHEEKLFGRPISDPNINRQLNSTRLLEVYVVAHTNSINQMLKDNGRDAFYVPSQTVISFTNGLGPLGYTELSETNFANARGLADASNILPYFAGTGQTLARSYPDRVLSSAFINPISMSIYLFLILVIGLLAGLFVPKLPLNVPRRGFELYTWMAAFHADELVGEVRDTGLSRNMELSEIENTMGELRFRYVNHHTYT